MNSDHNQIPEVMDVPLYSAEVEESKAPKLVKSRSLTDNINRVTMLTRKASNLMDQQQKTDFEISELLAEQGFSQAEVEMVKAKGAKDIHQAIDLLTDNNIEKVLTPKGGFDCLICQSDVGQSRVIVLGCDHVFCTDCFTDYLTLKVNEAQVLSIRCPHHKCETILSEETVTKYLNPPLIEKYRKFRQKGELSKDPHVRWCPVANCEGYSIGSSNKKHLTCSVCLHEYCYYCSEAWHGDAPCKEQGDQLLDAWARENNVRYCPNCRLRVEKMMGCSHMVCSQCQYQWCWLCGEHWTDSHFATCPEFRRWWQDPPFFVILLCLLAPFSMVFLNILIILLIGLSMNDGEDGEMGWLIRNKCLGFSLVIIVSLIFSPICFVLFIVGFPIYLAVETCKSCNTGNFGSSLVALLMILYAGLLLLAILIASVLLMALGLVVTVTKIYLAVKRCFSRRTEHVQRYNAMW